MSDITTKTFSDLENEGQIVTGISPNATFLIKQGNQSVVVKWSTLLAAVTVENPPPVSSESPFILNAQNGGSFNIPANKNIIKIAVNPSTNGTLNVGITNGGGEIIDRPVLAADGKQNINLGYDFDVQTTVFVSAIDATVKIYFI